MMNRRTNEGFSALEVMIACVILSLGLLPVFSMMTAGTRQSNFSEYTLFAAPRAKRIVEAFLTFDSRYFSNLGTEKQLDISSVVFGEEPPLPAEYLAKLDRDGYQEKAEWKGLSNGLGVITVTIEWTFPADGQARGNKPHRFVMKRLVGEPDLSMTNELELTAPAVQS